MRQAKWNRARCESFLAGKGCGGTLKAGKDSAAALRFAGESYEKSKRFKYREITRNCSGGQYQPGQPYMGINTEPGKGFDLILAPGAKDHIGEIQAWRVDGKPHKQWTKTFKSQNWGPLLVTAGCSFSQAWRMAALVVFSVARSLAMTQISNSRP